MRPRERCQERLPEFCLAHSGREVVAMFWRPQKSTEFYGGKSMHSVGGMLILGRHQKHARVVGAV